MIDHYEQVCDLVEAMRQYLPMPTYATASLVGAPHQLGSGVGIGTHPVELHLAWKGISFGDAGDVQPS